MKFLYDLRTYRAAVLVSFVLCVGVSGAQAQTMSFSTYFDGGMNEEGTTLYGYVDVSDNSSGCSHGSYQTTATLYSPSYRQGSSWSYGLSSSTSISLDDEYGNYSLSAYTTYQCSCMMYNTISYSSSITFGAGLFAYRFDYQWAWLPWVGRYVRCNPGSQCREMDVLFSKITPEQTNWPLYIYQKVTWIGAAATACAGFDIGAETECRADIYIP